jgi:hypothetical protein
MLNLRTSQLMSVICPRTLIIEDNEIIFIRENMDRIISMKQCVIILKCYSCQIKYYKL